jgi:hypothetical protein
VDKAVHASIKLRKSDTILPVYKGFSIGVEQGISINDISEGPYVISIKLFDVWNCHLFPPECFACGCHCLYFSSTASHWDYFHLYRIFLFHGFAEFFLKRVDRGILEVSLRLLR